MNLYCIKNGCIVTQNEYIKTDLWIEGSIIRAIGSYQPEKNYEVIDAKNCYITPGLIDIHVHGGVGCNFLEPTANDLIRLKLNLISKGITSILPTIMTAKEDEMKKAMLFLSEYINMNDNLFPEFIGINLEGPFLSPQNSGIHSINELQEISIEKLKIFLNKNVKIITIAPELDKTPECIKYLTNENVIVSMGHSMANFEESLSAVMNGIKLSTHLYNTMTPFHHRQPGIITTALVEDSVYVELIADGIHVHPAAIKLAIKAKPKDKVILVSDSIALRECPDLDYYVGGKKIYIKNNKAVNEDGVISGSILSLDHSIRNLVSWGLVDFKTAISYATINPAKLLNLVNIIGIISPGYCANIVLWDIDTLKIVSTIAGGKIYNHENT